MSELGSIAKQNRRISIVKEQIESRPPGKTNSRDALLLLTERIGDLLVEQNEILRVIGKIEPKVKNKPWWKFGR